MKRKKTNNQRTILIFLIIGTVILYVLALKVHRSYKKRQNAIVTTKINKEQSVESGLALVTLELIKKRDFSDILRGVTGRIDVARAKLGFEVSGQIAVMGVDKGDEVREGDILAEIDKTDLLLKEKYKQNSLEGVKLELEKARKILEDNKEKAETGFILKSKIEDYELDVKLKENKVKAAMLEVEAAIENLKKAELRAPFFGVVLERNIELGESISANKEAFVLLDINNIYADIEINEKKLSRIEPGQSISLRTSIYPEEVIGEIKSVVPAIQGKAMVLSARAKLAPTKSTLLPGMFVVGDILAHEEKDSIVLPIEAVFKQGDEVYVFIYDQVKKIVKKRTVDVGYITRKEVLIKRGLKEGLKVIIKTTKDLKDGSAVRVIG